MGVVALLAMAAMQAPQPPAGQPSMVVTPEQFAAALAICRDQIGRAQLAPDELAAKGWPKVMSRASDGTAPSLAVYRHPENMMMLGFNDSPAGPDECFVMAPTGPTLDMARAEASLSALVGARGRQRGSPPSWRIEGAEVRLFPMASGGVRVVFAQKDKK
jgi:hypothetical protein